MGRLHCSFGLFCGVNSPGIAFQAAKVMMPLHAELGRDVGATPCIPRHSLSDLTSEHSGYDAADIHAMFSAQFQ